MANEIIPPATEEERSREIAALFAPIPCYRFEENSWYGYMNRDIAQSILRAILNKKAWSNRTSSIPRNKKPFISVLPPGHPGVPDRYAEACTIYVDGYAPVEKEANGYFYGHQAKQSDVVNPDDQGPTEEEVEGDPELYENPEIESREAAYAVRGLLIAAVFNDRILLMPLSEATNVFDNLLSYGKKGPFKIENDAPRRLRLAWVMRFRSLAAEVWQLLISTPQLGGGTDYLVARRIIDTYEEEGDEAMDICNVSLIHKDPKQRSIDGNSVDAKRPLYVTASYGADAVAALYYQRGVWTSLGLKELAALKLRQESDPAKKQLLKSKLPADLHANAEGFNMTTGIRDQLVCSECKEKPATLRSTLGDSTIKICSQVCSDVYWQKKN